MKLASYWPLQGELWRVGVPYVAIPSPAPGSGNIAASGATREPIGDGKPDYLSGKSRIKARRRRYEGCSVCQGQHGGASPGL